MHDYRYSVCPLPLLHDEAAASAPDSEAKELIAGFSLIQAKSKAEAIDWAKRWPAMDSNGEFELEIRQVFGAGDFGPEFTPELREAEQRQRAHLAGQQ